MCRSLPDDGVSPLLIHRTTPSPDVSSAGVALSLDALANHATVRRRIEVKPAHESQHGVRWRTPLANVRLSKWSTSHELANRPVLHSFSDRNQLSLRLPSALTRNGLEFYVSGWRTDPKTGAFTDDDLFVFDLMRRPKGGSRTWTRP
ncbi:MAG: hypothetical protein C5B57_11785 [Blastocatellia bacterium]|nr:MAG: hypothetical protein C5B57_11785 [Blastocatellia bacterium]